MDRISNGERVIDGLPVMKTHVISPAATSGATDTLPAPGAGFKLVIFAAILQEGVNAAFNATGFGALYFVTSGQHVLRSSLFYSPGAILHVKGFITGVKVEGAENEALTLLNNYFDAGESFARALVFYRIVPV